MLEIDYLSFSRAPTSHSSILAHQDEILTFDLMATISKAFVGFEATKYYPKTAQDWVEICASTSSADMFSSRKISYVHFDDYVEGNKPYMDRLIKASSVDNVYVFLHKKDSKKLSNIAASIRIMPFDLEKNFTKWASMKLDTSSVASDARGYILAELTDPSDLISLLSRLEYESLDGTLENVKYILENSDISHFAKKLIYGLTGRVSLADKDKFLLELEKQGVSISMLVWHFVNHIKRMEQGGKQVKNLLELYNISLGSRIYDEEYAFLLLRRLMMGVS